MGRHPEGQLVARQTKSGITYSARFTAYGRRWFLKLGDSGMGMRRQDAQLELDAIIADVRRGRWLPPRDDAAPPVEATQTFHELASRWLDDRRRDLSEAGYRDYHWQLTNHLLPAIGQRYPLEITADEIDRIRTRLLDNGLSPTSVNKCLRLLAQILDVAEDYGLISGNPARNRRRYAKRTPTAPVWLDRPEHIKALLDAAAAKEASPLSRTSGQEAFIAVLLLAGLRISEACELRWRAIDFHNDKIRVEPRAKTQAGFREIDLFPGLARRLRAARPKRFDPDSLVFTTATGRPRDRNNARQRIVDPVVEAADQLLLAQDMSPLPRGVTAHKLRHTFASVLIALGYDPATVQEQLGHSDARFTLNVYTHQMRRSSDARNALARLVG